MVYRRKCPANVWTKVIFDFGRGYPEERQIKLLATNGMTVTGHYREIHYNWIFPCKPILGELQTSMLFHRRWIDGIYAIYIRPDIEVECHPT